MMILHVRTLSLEEVDLQQLVNLIIIILEIKSVLNIAVGYVTAQQIHKVMLKIQQNKYFSKTVMVMVAQTVVMYVLILFLEPM